MSEFVELIVQYISIWLPSLVSIGGTVASVLLAINKSRQAIQEVRSTSDFQELKKALKAEIQSNEELKAQVALLTDKVAKIKGYSEEMLKDVPKTHD